MPFRSAIYWLTAVFALVTLPPALSEDREPVIRQYLYKKTDRGGLELICRFPAAWQPTDSRPAILFFYGGGFWTRNLGQFARQADYFARRGLVTILADYRTGDTYGSKPPAAFEDARSAMRWLRLHATELGIDANRIAAAGGSAGGAMAASLDIADGLDAMNEDQGISVRPNLLLLYNPVLPMEFDQQAQGRYGTRQAWARTAAALHASKQTPPTLLLYGAKDTLLGGGKSYAENLRKLDLIVVIDVTEGVGHGFFNFAPHLADTTRRVAAFLEAQGWLKPNQEVPLPSGAAELTESATNPERGRAATR